MSGTRVARWPAVPLELAFNIAAIGIFLLLRRRGKMRGQHFHLYLIAYGAFRFAHEWTRATPKIAGIISGYQLAALACVALGVWGFLRRAMLERAAAVP
jgi:phosphatidylglycerol:prolipoprotein diacylglycerol transferase